MKPTLINLSSILVSDRIRVEMGDIPELAESIKQYGLIQPLVIDQNNRLVAGGRRYYACSLLNMQEVPVFYKETLSETHHRILELEENIRRKSMTWQETCLGIAEMHQIKKNESALEGVTWGVRETGAMLGQAFSTIQYAVQMAKLLKEELDSNGKVKENAEYWLCENFSEAWKLRMYKEQKDLEALNAKNQTSHVASISPSLDNITPIPNQAVPFSQLDKEQAKERYLANALNPPDEFESYWLEKTSTDKQRFQLPLSWLHHINCIEFMNNPVNVERFDHIITDPPYGIDMNMLSQENMGMANIATVVDEHQVKPNKELLVEFICAAYKCLKPNSFLVLWCDQMLWQFLFDTGVQLGFKPCRWPITWVKLHSCMNSAAQFNFTKATEIAIVFRKGNATLIEPASTNYVVAAHDDFKDTLAHPFVKPFACWEFILKHISYEGQLILEPFSGHGSGVISMLRMNRKVIACEKDEAHFNALVNNIKEHYLRVNPLFTFI